MMKIYKMSEKELQKIEAHQVGEFQISAGGGVLPAGTIPPKASLEGSEQELEVVMIEPKTGILRQNRYVFNTGLTRRCCRMWRHAPGKTAQLNSFSICFSIFSSSVC